MKLTNKPAFIRKLNEEKEKKRFNIGKFVYITIIFLILLFIIIKVGKNFIYVKGHGQIKISSSNVQELYDIRILNLLVQEGQNVNEGEALFIYKNNDYFNKTPNLNLIKYQDSILIERHRIAEKFITLKSELNKKIMEGKFNKKKIKKITEEIDCMKLLVLLKKEKQSKLKKDILELESLRFQDRKNRSDIQALLLKRNILNKSLKRNKITLSRLKYINDFDLWKLKTPLFNSQPLEITVKQKKYSRNTELILEGNMGFKFDIYKNNRSINIRLKENPDNCKIKIKKGINDSIIDKIIKKKEEKNWLLRIGLKKNCIVTSCIRINYPYKLILTLQEKEPDKNNNVRKIIISKLLNGKIFRAPIKGIITRIYFRNYEVALKGEKIMKIFKPIDLSIKAFFDQSDMNYLKKDQEVVIEFPDSSKYKGKINHLYYATLPLPPEFQKKYEPVSRSVVVDIIPDNYNLIKEKEFEKMSVTIWVSKKTF